MESQEIVVYGTSWCPDCRRARRMLDQLGRTYIYVDIETDPFAAAYVMHVNRGNRSVPTILFPDGSLLVEPSNVELQAKLTN